MADAENPTELIAEMGRRARSAALVLASMPSARKTAALALAAESIRAASAGIVAANAEDMARAADAGLSGALLDRLRLDEARVAAMADGVAAVAALADPVG